MLLRLGPGDQLAGLRAGNKPRTGNGAGEELGHVVRAGGAHVVERVDDHLRVFRPLHVDLVQRAPDRLVVFGICPGDELVGLRTEGELGPRGHLLEEGHRGRGRQRIQCVDDGAPALLLRVGGRGNRIDHSPNRLMVGRTGEHDQLLRVAPQAHPGSRNLGLQDDRRRRGRHPLHRVDLHLRDHLGGHLDVDLLQNGRDRFLVAGCAEHGQLLRVGGVGR